MTAIVAVVQALHQARQVTGDSTVRVLDVEGGWGVGVGIGNVMLSADGVPTCVGTASCRRPRPGCSGGRPPTC